jgi:hypothetical protein
MKDIYKPNSYKPLIDAQLVEVHHRMMWLALETKEEKKKADKALALDAKLKTGKLFK